ncbi:hypothetical protein GOV14_00120 [Candidatus Pacearchaeota archaeon]|nr:hypothetical protein [Candidatus Pacearchaeota archaeon]
MVKSTFRGLEVADQEFERTVSPCSSVLEDSCGTRDCQLEVYQLGGDKIFSGGRCPKGSTNTNSDKVPNYTKMYKGMLDKELSKITSSLEEMTDSPKILIPRSLTFLNEKGVFYTALYKNLGFDVSLSPESDNIIANLGKQHAHPECCYPIILAHGHAAFLKEKMRPGLDKLLLTNAFSVGEEKLSFCPYVCSSGYLVSGSLNLNHDDVLLPDFKFESPDYDLAQVIATDLRRVFKDRSITKAKVSSAIDQANKSQKDFVDSVHKTGRKIFDRLKGQGKNVFVGIGRGYTLLDGKASSDIDELFVSNGIHYMPSYLIGFDIEGDVVDNMYWFQGQSMLGSLIGTFNDKNVYPVRLTNFNCGPDSILEFHEDRLTDKVKKPYLCLETDGHNSNAQFGTRIQAHKRVTDSHEQSGKPNLNSLATKKPKQDFGNRILGVPYMGDSADVLAAAIRSSGLNAVVMPTRTDESIRFAKKLVTTNTCRPFAFQVGDHLAWLDSLKSQGIDVNSQAAVFMPTTRGPCRQGQYSVLLRHFFDREGFTNVPIMSPNSADDYKLEGIERSQTKKILRAALNGITADGVLIEHLHRIRPYETNSGETDKVYKKSHNRLTDLIENDASVKQLRQFLFKESDHFFDIDRDDKNRFPLVLVNGEIFVRCHAGSNQDSIKLLESHKLEAKLDPTFTWMDYVNRVSLREFWEIKDLKEFFKSSVKWAYMRHLRKNLQDPFQERLGDRMHYHNPVPSIDALEEKGIFSFNIKGESALSVAEANEFINGDLNIDGIYHVGPLGCMQETVATSRIQPMIHQTRKKAKTTKDKIIPFMDAVFGESESPALESQVAIFAENCSLRKKLRDEETNLIVS